MDTHYGMSVALCVASILMSISFLDGLVFPFLMVLPGQPVCNENFGARLIYNLDPVLMNFKQYALNAL